MPIMPTGGFRDITTLRANATTLRNLLSYAEREEDHPDMERSA